jgi:hypothetical protein
MIELTEQQISLLKQGSPVRIPVPQLGGDVVLLLLAPHETVAAALQEVLDDGREKEGWKESVARAQGRWASENPYAP